MPDEPSPLADTLSPDKLPDGERSAAPEETFATARTVSAGDPGANSVAFVRGTTVGRYVILDRIGEGGMGIVYSAYDPELDRKVAVKLLRYGAAGGPVSSEGRARLVREAQAMARLSHPNVIAVHDVGTYGAEVFVAMEFVEGGTLREWLATAHTWREIVALFVQAGRGLAAAHAVGIVHRDFKPDNVLVAKDGRARVADFGIAHAVDSPAPVGARARKSVSLDTPLTEHGTLLGTPLYMAPEQLSGVRTDASGDQFSFCVSLYEAVYGEMPFEGMDLDTLSSNVRAGKIRLARAGRVVPGPLRQALSRGLSSQPEARYPSMNALLAALERDPSRTRRRWLTVVAAVVVLVGAPLAVLGAHDRRPALCPSSDSYLAGVWDGTRRDAMRDAFRRTRKPYAEDALRGAEHELDSYAASWVAMHDETCAATRIRGEQSEELMDLRMACLNGRLAGLRALTAQLSRADDGVVQHAVQAADGLEPLRGCADVAALREPTALPSDPAVRQRIEATREKVASARATRMTASADALSLARTEADAAKEVGYRPLEADALDAEGALLSFNGKFKQAVAVLNEAVLAAEAGHDDARETDAWIDLTRAEIEDGHFPQAGNAAGHAHACLERGGGDDAKLATLLEAEGVMADDEGHYEAAIDLEKRALTILERIRPRDHPDIADCLDRLGTSTLNKGDIDGALELARRAVAIREQAFGPESPWVASSLQNVGNALFMKGENGDRDALDAALAADQRAIALQTAAFGADSVAVSETLGNLGLVLDELGRHDEAIDTDRRVLAIRLRELRPDHPFVAIAYLNLAAAEREAGRLDDAIADAERCVAIEEKTSGVDGSQLGLPLAEIGHALLAKGDAAHAVVTLERAVRLAEKSDGDPDKLADMRKILARALVANHGDRARAYALAMQARAYLVTQGEPARGKVEAIDMEFPRP